ncbi:hypothetical protein [Roseovarius arcticus]|uniref:hypothetical protein n=1 Tax=Roseovarius arcticus TaxID=2547404 RepID=UPI0014871FA9|nr:hypothetical protein [Roseovarius arcticus]
MTSAIAMALLLGLPSCGFTPVYGENSASSEVLRNVVLEDPDNQIEYDYLKAVEQRIPPSQNTQYKVRYNVALSYQGLDVVGVSRVQVVGTVTSEFVDQTTQKVELVSSVEGFTSYTADGGFRDVQRRDAERRLMQILADKFITRLIAQSSELGAIPE